MRNEWTDELRRLIVELATAGFGTNEIAHVLSVPKSLVTWHRQRAGVPTPPKSDPMERVPDSLRRRCETFRAMRNAKEAA